MTYMYPNYVLVHSADAKQYGVHLYRDGWRAIDDAGELLHLAGAPVLFVPGNGGSYKQVRSLGGESEKLFSAGFEAPSLNALADLLPEEVGPDDISGATLRGKPET
eukprot:SM004289S15706  [mRNA]  locus=s4289:44:1020:+ [translate_table: standard]